METVSENTPKPKRGRPKSYARTFADELDKKGYSSPSIRTTRGKVNSALAATFIGLWIKAPSEIQLKIMGCCDYDIKAGTHCFPRGFDTAATEIGRWIASHDGDDEAKQFALNIVANARNENIPWRDIRAHFRKLRLGKREGNAISLFLHLSRAFDEYMAQFPATTLQVRVAAVRDLLDAIEPSDE